MSLRRPVGARGTSAPSTYRRARVAGRRLLRVIVVAIATLATALARPRGAGAVEAVPTGAAGPVSEDDGGALAQWIAAEVVVLVVGVVALRLWTDHRRRRRREP